jgi:hypothetical protein
MRKILWVGGGTIICETVPGEPRATVLDLRERDASVTNVDAMDALSSAVSSENV